MRTNLLLTKALIVVALLLGGVSSVWAQTTKTLYSQNFNSEANLPTGWTQASGTLTLEASGGNKWLREAAVGSGSRTAWYTGTDIKDAIGTNTSYVLEFDCLIKEGTNTTNYCQGVWVTGSDLAQSWGTPTGYAIGVKKGSNETTYTIQANGASTDETVNLTTNTWYHYVCAYDHSDKKITFSILSQDKSATIYTAHEFGYDYSADNKGVFQSIHIQAGRGSGYTEIDNILLTTEVDEEVVDNPVVALTAVNGTDRTVTITGGTSSDGTATVTTYYTTDGSDPTSASSVYSSALTITEDCTVKAISISDKGGTSNVSSLAVTAGAITLNAPTFTRTAYSAGVSTVTLSCNQTDKTLSPTATIHWSTGTNSGDGASGISITVNDGETLEAYCVATGYTNSSTLSVTAKPYVGTTVWTEGYTETDGQTITLGDEVETGLYKMLASSGTITVSDYLLTYNSNINSYFLLRNSTCPGIYSGNGRTYAITGLTAGQHVVITTNNGSETATVNAGTNLTKDTWETWPSHFAFDVTADGTATFSINRYCSVASITVYSTPVPATIGANGYTTFASPYPLDLAHLPEGLKAYTATLSGVTLSFTECTQAVAAGTGLLLQGTGGETYNIPVVASGTAITDNALTGVTAVTPLKSDETNYIFAMKKANSATDELLFAPLTSANNVNFPAGKAYITVPASAFATPNTARALVLTFDDATSVKELKNSGIEELKAYYNLQGQRVASPKKGLYIVNGRKVQVK